MNGDTKANRSGSRPRPIQVVLIEDRDARDGIKDFLEANGCLVRVARTANAALAGMEERVPDVLIVDAALGDGRVAHLLADRLQREGRTRQVARIAITASKEERGEKVVGFDAYLARPVELLLLLDIVRNLTYASREPSRDLTRAMQRA